MLANQPLRLTVSVVERHPSPEVWRAIGAGLAAKLRELRFLTVPAK